MYELRRLWGAGGGGLENKQKNILTSTLGGVGGGYDLHYCPGSKNYRRQNKMTFPPELYIVALKKRMVYVLYIFNLYIYQKFL